MTLPGQVGYDDCGLFALAYATTLCKYENPAKYIYKQDTMRYVYNQWAQFNYISDFEKIYGDDLQPRHKIDLSNISM